MQVLDTLGQIGIVVTLFWLIYHVEELSNKINKDK